MRITKVIKEFIFDTSNAPTPSVHASTVVKTRQGDLIAAWFGGQKESAQDVRIWYSIRRNGKWSAPAVIEDGMDVAHWNPVLLERRSGEICLYYKVGVTIPTWQTYMVTSTDGGMTFGAPCEVVPGDVGGRGPVKNKAIYLSNGTLLAPASNEVGQWYPFIDLSHDEGKSWEMCMIPLPDDEKFPTKPMVIQPTLWESEPGRVHALMRANRNYAYRSDSEDHGRTWCTAYVVPVPNNNSGLDAVGLGDNTVVLASNPVAKYCGPRTPLTLSVSYNNGMVFEHLLTLEDLPGEYSYPTIIADEEKLYVTYTHERKTIAFVEVQYVK